MMVEIAETVRNQPTIFQLSLRKNIAYAVAPCLAKIPTSSDLTP